jgi:hypothetical protein
MNFINFGYPETGVLSPNDLFVYRLEVESNKQPSQLTFKVSCSTGEAVIFIKKCTFPQRCLLKLEDIFPKLSEDLIYSDSFENQII